MALSQNWEANKTNGFSFDFPLQTPQEGVLKKRPLPKLTIETPQMLTEPHIVKMGQIVHSCKTLDQAVEALSAASLA